MSKKTLLTVSLMFFVYILFLFGVVALLAIALPLGTLSLVLLYVDLQDLNRKLFDGPSWRSV